MKPPAFRAYTALPFTAVRIEDVFWAPRQRTNTQRTLGIEYQACKTTGRVDSFKLQWKPGMKPVPHIFWDSDVAKWIEAASYSLATQPDSDLERLLDETIALIASAQQPDGYLNTHFTQVEPEKRWTNLRDQHELYCAGHMIEAAVAHFQATGKRSLLDVVCRYADYIITVFGTAPGQKRGYPGHEEIELALVKLYHVTNQPRYLALAQYFVDERGRQPHYYDQEAIARGDDPAKYWAKSYAYSQSHIPVRQQSEVVGHAVRAMYLYSAMADLAGESGDLELLAACERLWDDLTLHKLYLTGGIGPSSHNEGFTTPYDLPNETAYAETCAAVGLVFWAHRMLQFHCDRKYADVLETALYNGALSGVSLDGERFFYENPLASLGNHHRQPWFDCACCPPNIARLLASLGDYIYSYASDQIAVHLYIQGSGRFNISGQTIILKQNTAYPWDGKITIDLDMPKAAQFTLRLRVPGWCRGSEVRVFGERTDMRPHIENGYLVLTRNWQPGDMVELNLPMPVERIYAYPDVRADAGKVALRRGPLVYCFEAADNHFALQRAVLPGAAQFTAHFEPNLLGGVTTLSGELQVMQDEGWHGNLYRSDPPEYQPCPATAIPYYAWDNRSPGQMAVWLPEINK